MIHTLIKEFLSFIIICQVVLISANPSTKAFISLALAQQALHITNGSEDPAICFELAAGRKSAGDANAEEDRKVFQTG